MTHEDFSLTEWNDTADTLRDLADGVSQCGRLYVEGALASVALCSLPDAEVQND